MRLLVVTVIVLCIPFSFVLAQEHALPLEKTQRVAAESLATLGQLVTRDNFRIMGFDSPGEVSEVSLGEPLQEYMVRLDELQKYAPDTDPEKLLKPMGQVVYPVMTPKGPRSAIVVGESGGKLGTQSVGAANYIRLLVKARKGVTDTSGLPASSFFTVRVPALNVRFLGHRQDRKLLLTPILDEARFDFRAGSSIPAEKAFAAMQSESKAHDGLPR